jgi:hypothetical protein
MNDRIKQIEEQCYIKPGGYYPGSDWPEPFFDKHKFAELIIQECAELINNKVTITAAQTYDEVFVARYDTKELCAKQIKEHFGIEE